MLDALPFFFVGLPIGGFIWAYAVVLTSVDRLGRRALELDPFPQDRTLGLRPIGSLVVAGFGVLSLGALLYVVALGGRYLGDLLIVMTVFGFGLAVMVLSMWRLHRQMVATKEVYVARARRLYSEAYAPLAANSNLATLGQRAPLLKAAQDLEQRAESIYEWPLDDRLLRTMAVVVTGVLTGLVVRATLTLVGQ